MTLLDSPLHQVREWKVLRLLGKARNGTFYEVERAGHRSVMKWVAPGLENEDLVKSEVDCLQRVAGPLFVALEAHDRWPDQSLGGWFLVLENVPGVSLTQWYSTPGPTARDIMRVFERIATALVVMHDAGVRYPHLTCDDVKLREGGLQPVIIDLGGAFAGEGPVPEAETTGDVRSMGVMLYETLTRRQPGPLILPPHVINPRVPRDLSDFAMRLLSP